jgi:hypothetical protein
VGVGKPSHGLRGRLRGARRRRRAGHDDRTTSLRWTWRAAEPPGSPRSGSTTPGQGCHAEPRPDRVVRALPSCWR